MQLRPSLRLNEQSTSTVTMDEGGVLSVECIIKVGQSDNLHGKNFTISILRHSESSLVLIKWRDEFTKQPAIVELHDDSVKGAT